ncbi:MAG: hypothetical protein WKF54_08115 [Nocardioidaceae bacterium]
MRTPDIRRYRWSRAYGLRFLGVSLMVLAVAWLVAALSGFQVWSLVLLGLVGLVVVVLLLRLVVVPPVLLEVSSAGYRLRHVRGGGVAQADWSDVASVDGGRTSAGAVMSIVLTDGGATQVPLVLLGGQGSVAERDVRDRLNAAFGYRRLGAG